MVVKSAKGLETGEYKLEYGNLSDPLEDKFVLRSE